MVFLDLESLAVLDDYIIEVHIGGALVAHVDAHVAVLLHDELSRAQRFIVAQRGGGELDGALVDQHRILVEGEHAQVGLGHAAGQLVQRQQCGRTQPDLQQR